MMVSCQVKRPCALKPDILLLCKGLSEKIYLLGCGLLCSYRRNIDCRVVIWNQHNMLGLSLPYFPRFLAMALVTSFDNFHPDSLVQHPRSICLCQEMIILQVCLRPLMHILLCMFLGARGRAVHDQSADMRNN